MADTAVIMINVGKVQHTPAIFTLLLVHNQQRSIHNYIFACTEFSVTENALKIHKNLKKGWFKLHLHVYILGIFKNHTLTQTAITIY